MVFPEYVKKLEASDEPTHLYVRLIVNVTIL